MRCEITTSWALLQRMFVVAWWLVNAPSVAYSQSGSVPDFDIAAGCRDAANVSGCERIQTEAKKSLTALWPGLSAATRVRCQTRGEQMNKSYVTVLGCAENQ
jgi:hypothetical protein